MATILNRVHNPLEKILEFLTPENNLLERLCGHFQKIKVQNPALKNAPDTKYRTGKRPGAFFRAGKHYFKIAGI